MSQAPHTELTSPSHVEATHQHHGVHPGPRQYVGIAVVLAIITAVEVGVYYMTLLRPVLPPILIVLSITKFGLVALWFMHLKFDSRLFSVFFVTGILTAITVFIVFLTLLRVFFA